MKRTSRRSKTLGARPRMTDELDVPLTACSSAEACEHYPRIFNDYTLVLTARLPGPEVSHAVVDHFDHTWLTTSYAIYDRMAERSPAP